MACTLLLNLFTYPIELTFIVLDAETYHRTGDEIGEVAFPLDLPLSNHWLFSVHLCCRRYDW